MRVYTHPYCESHVNRNSHVETPERYPAMLAGVEAAERAGVKIEHVPIEPVSEETLLAAHDASYLDSLKEASASGGGYFDSDTAVNEHSWETALLAGGAAIGAVEGAMNGEPSFAVVRPPGHHATRNRAMGFCLINHAAVAARHAAALGASRVAVLDWDVHHDNGTQDIFYMDSEVLYLSVHRGGAFYPGTGYVDEVGEGEGKGMTINAPLPARSEENLYAEVFSGVFLPVLREFGPDLIVVSAGYDAHAADPLGGMRLDADSFGRFAATLAAFVREAGAAPLAFAMEGGYDLAALSRSVAATIEGAEGGGDPGWKYAGSKPVEAVRQALSPRWKSLRD
ncbi:MAG: histone deacetylase family protein [Rubrobacteraceae bacterium]